MDIAVLFGAGASFGAGNVFPDAPPLGRDLFDHLQKAYPESWGSLLHDDEVAIFRDDFEQGFALLWGNQGESRAQRLIIDMALFFTRFTLVGPNAYSRLLHLLLAGGTNRVCFCTLNYECLLEQAISEAGLSVFSLGRQIGTNSNGLPVLKPHGSCNYLSPMTRNMTNVRMGNTGHAYVHYETATFNELEIVPREEVPGIYTAAEGFSIPPAISLYDPTKHSPVGAGAIGLVRDQWASIAAQADVVLAIGARPVAHDGHVWEPVLKSGSAIWFVGGMGPEFGLFSIKAGDRLRYLGRDFGQSLPSIHRLLTL